MAQHEAPGGDGFEIAQCDGLNMTRTVRVCEVLGETDANFGVPEGGLHVAVVVEDEAAVLCWVDVDEPVLLKSWRDALVIGFKTAAELQDINGTVREREVGGVIGGVDGFGEPMEMGRRAAAGHFAGGLPRGNEGRVDVVFGEETGPIVVVDRPTIEGVGDAGVSQAIGVKGIEPGMVEVEEDRLF